MTYKFLLLFAALRLISRSQSAVEKRAAEGTLCRSSFY